MLTPEERREMRERWSNLFRALNTLDAAEARVAELEKLLAEARELVEEAEWAWDRDSLASFCPCCNCIEPHHAPDCRLAAFLAKTTPTPPASAETKERREARP